MAEPACEAPGTSAGHVVEDRYPGNVPCSSMAHLPTTAPPGEAEGQPVDNGTRGGRVAGLTPKSQDKLIWRNEQARILRNGIFDQVDVDGLREEVDQLVDAENKKVLEQLKIILTSLLILHADSAEESLGGGSGLEMVVNEARGRLQQSLERSPCLLKMCKSQLEKAFQIAKDEASKTIPIYRLPSSCPYGVEDLHLHQPASLLQAEAAAVAGAVEGPSKVDFVVWASMQSRLLQEKRLDALDTELLASQLEIRNERADFDVREAVTKIYSNNHIIRSLPTDSRCSELRRGVQEAQDRLNSLLKSSPSLHDSVKDQMQRCYEIGLNVALPLDTPPNFMLL